MGASGAVRVIVPGTRAEVAALAARHGVRVGKTLKTGAVILATPEQIRALTADPAVPSLAADTAVVPMMAVTTSATGEDQAWAGLGTAAGVTGRGVGIAVIDSGVTLHDAVRGKVGANVDFTRYPVR